MTLYKLKKSCYLLSCLDARRMLLFMVEHVFLWMGRFGQCIMWVHNTQCGERGGQRAEKSFLCVNFSCLAINKDFISHNQASWCKVPASQEEQIL